MAITTTYSTQTLVSEFQVNTWTSNNQLLPDSVGLDNGGWVTAYNNDGNFVLLNFYDADGVAVGGFDIPYSGGTSGAGQPSITKLANGNVLVIWDENEAGNEGLSGRIFSQDGVALGNELKFTGNSISFEDPDVAALSDGGYVISFTFGGNVFFGRYNSSGGQIGGFTQVNTAATTGTQNDASIAVLADGGWVVTYTDTDPANQPVRAVVYNADGTVRAADFLIDGIGDNTQSVVQALSDGRFAVVYTDSGWAEGGTLGNGITLQLFNANGSTATGWIHVNTPATNDEREPDITVLDNGFIVVSWTRPFAGTDDDIYGAIYDQNGNLVMSQFSIAGSSDTDIRSAVAGLLNGEFVTTWQDSQTDGSGGRISGTVRALVRTTTGDGANDTINVDSLRDIVNAGDGDDTIMGGGI
ncbi:hypothetical protein DUP91_27860, partial [Salmonella enterica subsp. enterica]|nr:hypothetical protein [Salmonella enterica subsp. enterica]